jgi:hypothetical protein
MNKKTYPLTLVDEIQERLNRLSVYLSNHADLPMTVHAETEDHTTIDILRSCIRQLMDVTVAHRSGVMRPLFCRAAHWQAIYRIMVDYNLGASEGDFVGFSKLATQIMPEGCRVPFSYDALRDISKTPFVRPFAKWHYDNVYFRTRKPYEQMNQVATAFLQLLKEKGLVKG